MIGQYLYRLISIGLVAGWSAAWSAQAASASTPASSRVAEDVKRVTTLARRELRAIDDLIRLYSDTSSQFTKFHAWHDIQQACPDPQRHKRTLDREIRLLARTTQLTELLRRSNQDLEKLVTDAEAQVTAGQVDTKKIMTVVGTLKGLEGPEFELHQNFRIMRVGQIQIFLDHHQYSPAPAMYH